jgi:hypothetical protein
LLKPAQALARLKSPPRGRNRSLEFLRTPETFSPPFSLLCPWIHGPFPAIEFAVAPSSSLPYSSDPGATLARVCLNSGDLTTAERSGGARSNLFHPRSDPLRPIQIERPGPRGPLRARASDALSRLLASPAAAHPSWSDSLRPILIEQFGLFGPLGPPRTPSRPIVIERLGPPRTPVAIHLPSSAGPTRSVRSLSPLSLTLLVPLVSARPPAPARPRPQI